MDEIYLGWGRYFFPFRKEDHYFSKFADVVETLERFHKACLRRRAVFRFFFSLRSSRYTLRGRYGNKVKEIEGELCNSQVRIPVSTVDKL